MRLPAEEDNPLACSDGPRHLGEHPLFTRFDESPAAKPEGIPFDHRTHDAVAVVAGLDAVDSPPEPFAECLQIGEVTHAGGLNVLRHR